MSKISEFVQKTLDKIRVHPKIFLFMELLFIVVGMCLYRWLPGPGIAVAVLGFVAAVVTIQGPISDGQKILWMIAVFILLVVEIRSINRERIESANAQKESREREEKNFREIASGIEGSIAESQRQFLATMNRSSQIMTGVEDSIKNTTGGDSFAYITLTGPEPPFLAFENFSHPSGPWMLVSLTSHGKYPPREIHATLMDDERRMAAVQEYNKHPDGEWMKAIQSGDTDYRYPYLRPQSAEAPSGDVVPIGAYPIPQGTSKRLSIAFSGSNGHWIETLHLGLVNGNWHQCLSILGPTIKQSTKPFIWCDSDWPEGKTLAEKDWAGLQPPARKR